MPVVAFVDPDSIHNPTSGGVAPATWFTTIEADFRSITGRVGCSISATATQDVTTPGTTTITLGNVDWNNGMTTGAVANAITVPASYAGKYLITASCRMLTVPTGANYCTVDLNNNGAIIARDYARRSSGSGAITAASLAIVYPLAVGDDITITTETSTNISDGDTEVAVAYPTLTAVWLSA